VLEQQETPASPEHARGFCYGRLIVWYGAQRERDHHHIKRFIGEGKCCGIANAQVGLREQIVSTLWWIDMKASKASSARAAPQKFVRPAAHGSAAPRTRCFGTHVSILAPPSPGVLGDEVPVVLPRTPDQSFHPGPSLVLPVGERERLPTLALEEGDRRAPDRHGTAEYHLLAALVADENHVFGRTGQLRLLRAFVLSRKTRSHTSLVGTR
jgi:hypothetical protein